jgi:hypothetical protein
MGWLEQAGDHGELKWTRRIVPFRPLLMTPFPPNHRFFEAAISFAFTVLNQKNAAISDASDR